MSKVKTHKASSKRFGVTGTGKVKMNRQNRRHKLGKKSAKRKMALRGTGYMSESHAPTIRHLIQK